MQTMASNVKQDEDEASSRADDMNAKMESCSIKKTTSAKDVVVPAIKKSLSIEKAKKEIPESREGDNNEESVEVVLGDEGKGSKVVGETAPNHHKEKSRTDQNVFRHPQTVRPMPVRVPSSGPPPPPPHNTGAPIIGHPPPPPHQMQHPPYPMHPHHRPPHPGSHPPYPPPPHSHHPYYPYPHGSGSWGYGPPPPPPPPGSMSHQGDYTTQPPPPPRAPYPVPPYSASSSFEDQSGGYHHHTPHYSPHVQYPPPSGRYSSEDVNVISPNHKVSSPRHRDPHYRPGPPSTPSRSRHLTPPKQYYQYPPTSPVSRPGASQSSGAPGAPILRNNGSRRDGSYGRSHHEDKNYHRSDDGWNGYSSSHPPNPSSRDPKSRHQAPIVADSFDSAHASRTSHPSTPSHHPHPTPTHSSDPHYPLYGGGGSWGSFDSGMGPPTAHVEDQRYYNNYPPPPDSPYSPYAPHYSPGPLYHADSFPSPGYGQPLAPAFSYSFDDDNARLLQDYNPDYDGDSMHKHVTPPGSSKKSGRSKHGTPITSNMSDRNALLPKAAEEIDFDVSSPPMEPITPEAEEPACESLAEVNSFDVLCGRGGGTNSQVGNRRFRQLVQEFQPIYLLAKRKEKPLLARTIVLIIRKRGGRFLKKNEETGQLFEVGDTKAEAKTSQALREGLDVRATKSAQNLIDKQKKNKKKNSGTTPKSPGSDTTMDSPMSTAKSNASTKESEPSPARTTDSPPNLPRLHGEGEVKVGEVHPHSPDQLQLRKRRRMRAADRFFNDFCPPRAEISQGCNPLNCGPFVDNDEDDGVLQHESGGHRDSNNKDYDVLPPRGCAGIALDIVTGAATASFCLGPSGWRR